MKLRTFNELLEIAIGKLQFKLSHKHWLHEIFLFRKTSNEVTNITVNMHMHRMTSHSILLICFLIMIELLDTENSKFTAYGSIHIAIELWCTGNSDNCLQYARWSLTGKWYVVWCLWKTTRKAAFIYDNNHDELWKEFHVLGGYLNSLLN